MSYILNHTGEETDKSIGKVKNTKIDTVKIGLKITNGKVSGSIELTDVLKDYTNPIIFTSIGTPYTMVLQAWAFEAAGVNMIISIVGTSTLSDGAMYHCDVNYIIVEAD